MPMKCPSHPGRLIKAELDELGLSITDAASALGVTRQQLYRVVRCDSGVSADMAVRLEKARIGVADFWLRVQLNFDLAKARAREAELTVTPLVPA